MPDALNNREGPQAREPSKCLNVGAMEKDWPKRPSDRQLQEARKKTDGAITPAVEAVHVPAHLVLPESLQAKQLCHLHPQLLLGQSCHRQKTSCTSVCGVASVVSYSFRPWRLWPASLLCQGAVFSRQEYRSVLANTGFHGCVAQERP